MESDIENSLIWKLVVRMRVCVSGSAPGDIEAPDSVFPLDTENSFS